MKKSELLDARRLAGIEAVTPDYAFPKSRQYFVEAKGEKAPAHNMPPKTVKPWVVKPNAKSTQLPALLKKNKDGGVVGEAEALHTALLSLCEMLEQGDIAESDSQALLELLGGIFGGKEASIEKSQSKKRERHRKEYEFEAGTHLSQADKHSEKATQSGRAADHIKAADFYHKAKNAAKVAAELSQDLPSKKKWVNAMLYSIKKARAHTAAYGG